MMDYRFANAKITVYSVFVCVLGTVCARERVRYGSSGQEMFRLEESFSEMLLRLSRCGRDVLHSSRRHKPGNEVKLFLRGSQRFMATVEEKGTEDEMTHEVERRRNVG